MNGYFPTRNEWRLVVRYSIALLIVAFFVLNGVVLLAGLIPFALAFVFSLAIDPVVSFLARRLKLGRGWGSFITLLLIMAVGGLFVAWAATAAVEQVARFIDALPTYRDTVVTFVEGAAERLTRAFRSLPPDVARYISENTSRLGQAAEQLAASAGGALLNVLKGLPGVITIFLIVPIATFFMSKDLPAVKRFLWTLVPPQGKAIVSTVIRDLARAAWRYLRAQGILILITTVITTLGLLIVGVDNWLIAGLVIGILDVLPVIGPIAAFAPWAAYLFITGETALAISILVVYAIAAGGRAIAEAKVVGDSVGLHPLATLMSIYVGALLWGVFGAVAGPVTLTVAKAVYKAWRAVSPPAAR